MKSIKVEKEQKLVVFRPKGVNVSVEVQLKDESLWLTQAQIAQAFLTERSVITKHIRNILQSKELKENSVCAFFAHTANDGKVYKTAFYNLDMIISIGYRVNSKRGTQFRIWATKILKQHLVRGYTINEKRLKEQADNLKALQRATEMLANLSRRKALTSDEAAGLFDVIRQYSYGLDVLDDYDHGRVEVKSTTTKESYRLTYDEGIRLVDQMRKKFGGSSLFGHEKDESFKSALGAIYQTFGAKDLYPSVEAKAANLLYLVVNNHDTHDRRKPAERKRRHHRFSGEFDQ
jgi:hypothetical protein